MRKSITRDEWSILVLFLAILLGSFMRLNPTILAGFSINDGGMFAVMVDDLKANHYLLPVFTTYNHLNIPFAYPPLGFYFGGIAGDLFSMDTTQVMRWVPAFFASLSIPAFYLLALRLLKDKYLASVSTLFFALMPRTFFWFVMGGGLTRSPGQFFMLLTLAMVIRLYEENRRGDIFLVGILGGLAVMSHPEAAIHTAVSAMFLWLMLSRKRITFIYSIFVSLVVVVVTAPWWGTVIHYHGIVPLLNAAATGSKTSAIFHLLFFVFTEEPYATFIAVLGVIGIGQRLIRRDYLLPLWTAIPFFVEGRSATGPASVSLAMLAAIGFVEVVLPALQLSVRRDAEQSGTVSSVERNVFLYVMLYLVFSTDQFGAQLANATLYPPDRDAMSWVHENTPEDSRFLVLTGTTSVLCDPVLEWFPALTGRKSLYTVQGTEWIEGENFVSYASSTYAVQGCLSGDDSSCLDTTVPRGEYDFIYLSKLLRVDNCAPLAFQRTFPYFLENMKKQPQFDVVYETDDVVIYKNNY